MKYFVGAMALCVLGYTPAINVTGAADNAPSQGSAVHQLLHIAIGFTLCRVARRSGISVIDTFKKQLSTNQGIMATLRQSENSAYQLLCSGATVGAGMLLINKGIQGLAHSLESPLLLELVNEQPQIAPKMPHDRRFQ